MLTILSPRGLSIVQTPPRRCLLMWSCPRQPSSPTSPCECPHGCWLWAWDGAWPAQTSGSSPAGPLTASPTLGTSRRRRSPRSSMRRLCPRARQLAWSSKRGPPGCGEDIGAAGTLRDANRSSSSCHQYCYYYYYSKMCYTRLLLQHYSTWQWRHPRFRVGMET